MLWVVNTLKWSLQQLYRLGKNEFNFSGEYDFSERIKDIDDILDISIVNVTQDFYVKVKNDYNT